ncbi:TetR/AcrR family transcriptional regulator [Paracraurococcus ruber]|uniref:HTH tetR-type domain-containing protein n=1 Tax=Paracraurococcus ruber TaxID=77675 RepID=A0ABS1CQT7_9PROT|nr:TetR/AcrR family transcriptional regulator [Paracraurococcus ruber]MBK1656783.1 hypothetical protein [Paracraurococcus ruber]TDG33610.1 TetR/AcrR family transcriptional regulator [Paracraurococcus ruber]
MRVSKAQAAANRARILEEAAWLFRERGLDGVGVDAVAEAAGLTHGSLYSQFGSKDRLAAAAVEQALSRSPLARLPEEAGPEMLKDVLARYLALAHRDAPGQGCAFAALGCEISRQSPGLRAIFTAALRDRAARLARLLPGRHGDQAREDAALAMLAGMIGALILARAVNDPALSDRILSAATEALAAPPGED